MHWQEAVRKSPWGVATRKKETRGGFYSYARHRSGVCHVTRWHGERIISEEMLKSGRHSEIEDFTDWQPLGLTNKERKYPLWLGILASLILLFLDVLLVRYCFSFTDSVLIKTLIVLFDIWASSAIIALPIIFVITWRGRK